MTNDEILDCLQKMSPLVKETQDGFFICVSGYDNDKRELWQIPEVSQFFKRIIKTGFMSLMEVSSSINGICRLDDKILEIGIPGLGAIEMWLISRNELKKEISQEKIKEFFRELMESNKILESNINLPSPDIKSNFNKMIEKYKLEGTFSQNFVKVLEKTSEYVFEGQNKFKGIQRN